MILRRACFVVKKELVATAEEPPLVKGAQVGEEEKSSWFRISD